MKVMPVATLSSKLSVVRVNNLDCGGEEMLLDIGNLILLAAKQKLNFSFAPSAPLLAQRGSRLPPASRSAPAAPPPRLPWLR